jgi:hypothetical protein
VVMKCIRICIPCNVFGYLFVGRINLASRMF